MNGQKQLVAMYQWRHSIKGYILDNDAKKDVEIYRLSVSENIRTIVFLMGKWHYYHIYLTFAFLSFIECVIANNFLMCVRLTPDFSNPCFGEYLWDTTSFGFLEFKYFYNILVFYFLLQSVIIFSFFTLLYRQF